MSVPWDPNLAVGVPLIDEEHQEIFRRANALLEAMHRGAGAQELGRLLEFLARYAELHFLAEERVMARHRYPEMADQLRDHQEFRGRIEALRSRFEMGGPSCDLSTAVNRLLCGWLRDHIRVADAALGRFLRAAGGSEAAEPSVAPRRPADT